MFRWFIVYCSVGADYLGVQWVAVQFSLMDSSEREGKEEDRWRTPFRGLFVRCIKYSFYSCICLLF